MKAQSQRNKDSHTSRSEIFNSRESTFPSLDIKVIIEPQGITYSKKLSTPNETSKSQKVKLTTLDLRNGIDQA